ncbi:protein of unknown function DUF1737 [Lactococcus phage PLG-II]|nr:protein of unknown function DUF1737 [Lactococcus phage PLG-II]
MKYKVVSELTIQDLEKEVNECLNSGWELYGELQIMSNDFNTFIACQPMTKK